LAAAAAVVARTGRLTGPASFRLRSRQFLDDLYHPRLASSAPKRAIQLTEAGPMVRKLIGKAALTVAVAGALATVAAASPPPGRPPTPPPVAQVSVQDIRVPVPGQQPVPAYLVRSAGALEPGSQAGILFLHWLGQIHSDRTEFLAEAIELAPRG